MAYGTFKGLKSKYYSEVTYTTDSAYSGISIFITDPKTMSLEEAIYTTPSSDESSRDCGE